MKIEKNFTLSKRLYAVDVFRLKAIETTTNLGALLYRYEIPAVWFKKRNGLICACMGFLWDYDYYAPDSEDLEDGSFGKFIISEVLRDGRYGGVCNFRLDQNGSFWSKTEFNSTEQLQALEFLEKMLAKFPLIPEGYGDNWFCFR